MHGSWLLFTCQFRGILTVSLRCLWRLVTFASSLRTNSTGIFLLQFIDRLLCWFLDISWNGHKNQLDLGLERILIKTVMPKVSSQHEIDDLLIFLSTENQNTIRRTLQTVSRKDVLEHFDSFFNLKLFLDHRMEDEIADS